MLTIADWHLPTGVHWLKGPTGAGKTPLFRSIAGMLPFEGTITLNGLDCRRDAVSYRLRVNYAEAEPTFPPFLTALELIRWVADAKQAPAGQADALIEAFGVGTFQHTPVGTYSSGMLKKLSLLLALLGTPRLVLLDEPLTTLDVATAARLFDLVRQLRAEQDVSFWLTSHQDVSLTGLTLTGTWQVGNGLITPLP